MKAKLLPLFFIGYLFLLTFPLFASSTDTTIYLSSIEKNLESGEIKVYYGAGNSSALRTIRRDGTTTLLYIHPDYLDSTVVVTNNTKNIVSNVKYYPYGNEVTPTTNITDKLYTNQRKDSASNLYFYNARYYNPNTTHFISADKAEGPNRYSYVSNNPIMKNDPSGNEGVYSDLAVALAKAWSPGANYIPLWDKMVSNIFSETKNINESLKSLSSDPISFNKSDIYKWINDPKSDVYLGVFLNTPKIENLNTALVIAISLSEVGNWWSGEPNEYGASFKTDSFNDANNMMFNHFAVDVRNTFHYTNRIKDVDARFNSKGALAAVTGLVLTLSTKGKLESNESIMMTDDSGNLTEVGKRMLGYYNSGGVSYPGVQRYFRMYEILKDFALNNPKEFGYLLTPFDVGINIIDTEIDTDNNKKSTRYSVKNPLE